jgi:sterol desaturase/sphingolipid hydroxylase (fatty acid hydroxylase superfamily)
MDWRLTSRDAAPAVILMLTARLLEPIMYSLVIIHLLSVIRWARGAIHLDLWPNGWPYPARFVLAAGAIQFIEYWIHRATHLFAPLWRLHGVHHHLSRMSTLVGQIFHPLEIFTFNMGFYLLISFGIQEADLIAVSSFFVGINVLAHSNLALTPPKPLRYVITTPADHYLHHSLNYAQSNKNFSCYLIIFDRIFGTYQDGYVERVEVGSGTGRRLDIFQQLLFPFRRPDRVEEPIGAASPSKPG